MTLQGGVRIRLNY